MTRYGVVGAGLAGAATAYHLTRQGARDVLIFEQERTAGMHASGQNAAMIRQVVPDPEIQLLAHQGAAFLHGEGRRAGIQFDPHGSLLLGAGETARSLTRDAEVAQAAGLDVRLLDRAEVLERVPVVDGNPFELAVECPGDGVVDVAGLLQHYLTQAIARGAELRTDFRVDQIERRPSGWQIGASQVDVLVNASGAWATRVARLAGASDLPLTPYRRHLIYSGPLDWAVPDWPFVWDVSNGLYFRPESSGLLLSACDQSVSEPCLPATDSEVLQLLGDKLARFLPRLADLPVNRFWAGLRTFSEDGRFVIGWDPLDAGFFWVAALAGHGVTTSYGVGALAARLLQEGPGTAHCAFDPARLATSAAS